MLSHFSPSRRLVFFYKFLQQSRKDLLLTSRPIMCRCKVTLCDTPLKLNIKNSDPYKMIITREKSSKKKIKHKRDQIEEEEDDDEDDDSDEEGDSEYHFKGEEVKTFETQAARVDKTIKICFKISRRNIEDLFYQTRVRINGEVLKKKSANVNIGDKIDIINSYANDNSKLLNINRIEILNIKEDPDNLKCFVKVKKSKSLIVHNYTGIDEWKG